MTITETTSPPSERMGVVSASTVILRPFRTETTTSSARSVRQSGEHLRQRQLAEHDLAPVGEATGGDLSQLLDRTARRAQARDSLLLFNGVLLPGPVRNPGRLGLSTARAGVSDRRSRDRYHNRRNG